ncbi:MAG: radical SAM protein [Elusimicrobia bacterium]|nr:radical SAM protein [Elusimicrobiota bacterium]
MDAKGKLILDGSKILWHQDRLEAWRNGKRFAPITIDMALTRSCNYKCEYCFSQLQENKRYPITMNVMRNFLDDCSKMGVRGISLVSDGESTMNPICSDSIIYGRQKGISMAMGSNGYLLRKNILKKILPALTYLRFNITAAEPERYAQIHGVPEAWYHQVIQNIRDAMEIKKAEKLDVTIGMQMVLMPEYEDQIVPLAKLGEQLQPDYLVIKHCSDDEAGSFGIDYGGYKKMYANLKEAEKFSNEEYLVQVKWSKIEAEGKRDYSRCYGPPFHLQISGSGLVAPCGGLFNEKYKKYHIGNFVESRFKDIVFSDRYWEVMAELASERFDAKSMCACLCLQHKSNEVLDSYKKGLIELKKPEGAVPQHVNFI